MLSGYWLILLILTVVAYASVKTSKLTSLAAVTGWIAGLLVFAGVGYAGVAMIAAFFIAGNAATSWGISAKQKLGLAEENKGKRTAGQVIANGGVAAILGVLAIFFPLKMSVLKLMMAASVSSAAADTLSSELGNLYGKNFYNIITFRRDERGLNGVISIEGTMAGICGSVIIASVYSLYAGFTIDFLLIIIAGTAGNLFDSVLGATAERKGFLTNNGVNFLNTAIAALLVLLFIF